ncbi:hypothetical protein Srubr_46170 [Streptomyces rubradiris]|uniref:Uncharacterized protein n=1 Tax=Streptomyces rubradiris TaxID=285531 RepID=A0ABQ3RG20_STRRR|nr:hypothetical protein GCM10018792_53310 [Streptomyces rubradiris]GHI54771.1 hypothetical protein Srubr_46170 [Streptomyces rubradiris]
MAKADVYLAPAARAGPPARRLMNRRAARRKPDIPVPVLGGSAVRQESTVRRYAPRRAIADGLRGLSTRSA